MIAGMDREQAERVDTRLVDRYHLVWTDLRIIPGIALTPQYKVTDELFHLVSHHRLTDVALTLGAKSSLKLEPIALTRSFNTRC